MLRKVSLLSFVLAAGLAVSLVGCSDKNKSDAPQVRDKPPPNAPKKLTPSGGGGGGKKPQGPGSANQ